MTTQRNAYRSHILSKSSVSSFEEEIRPRTLDERKNVLRETAADLGFPILKGRIKKASQYGSSTTELIRSKARSKGLRYNQYIAGIYESLGLRKANLLRDAVVDVRMDPIVIYDVEKILQEKGLTTRLGALSW